MGPRMATPVLRHWRGHDRPFGPVQLQKACSLDLTPAARARFSRHDRGAGARGHGSACPRGRRGDAYPPQCEYWDTPPDAKGGLRGADGRVGLCRQAMPGGAFRHAKREGRAPPVSSDPSWSRPQPRSAADIVIAEPAPPDARDAYSPKVCRREPASRPRCRLRPVLSPYCTQGTTMPLRTAFTASSVREDCPVFWIRFFT